MHAILLHVFYFLLTYYTLYDNGPLIECVAYISLPPRIV